MFTNFTEETCTGTGDTLALAGATTGMIPFSESFADGDFISYAVTDSGGNIKVTGIGTYVAATDDITRNDTWNWNGTAVDKNPTTNITLSGGTHTVTCAIADQHVPEPYNNFDWSSINSQISYCAPPSSTQGGTGKGRGTNVTTWFPAWLSVPTRIVSLGIDITTADAASANNLAAIYSALPSGQPGNLIVSTSHLSGANTVPVLETLAEPLSLSAGLYYFASKTDSSTLKIAGANLFINPMGVTRDERPCCFRETVVGALPATAPTSMTAENSVYPFPIYTTW